MNINLVVRQGAANNPGVAVQGATSVLSDDCVQPQVLRPTLSLVSPIETNSSDYPLGRHLTNLVNNPFFGVAGVERRHDRSGRIRMVVLPNFTAMTMVALFKEHIAPGSTVYTDGLKGFAGLQTAGYQHIVLKQPVRSALLKGASSVVPLADRAIGNLQH